MRSSTFLEHDINQIRATNLLLAKTQHHFLPKTQRASEEECCSAVLWRSPIVAIETCVSYRE
jgi:hypothetical protein